jgi:parallel beta-helix repeat protein
MFTRLPLIISICVTASVSFSVSSAFAAERVILSYGGITLADAPTETIVDFVKTGQASPAVQSYLNIMNLNPQQARALLSTEVPLSPAVLDKVLSSEIGKSFLNIISQTITSKNLAADIPAIKSALLLSVSDGGKISILKVIQNYPLTELNVEGSRLAQTVPQVQKFAQTLSNTQGSSLAQLLAPASTVVANVLPSGQPTLAASGVIFVNPQSGSDSSGGGQSISSPLRTISFALKAASSGSVIQLASGTYSAGSGEVFPLVIRSGVILKGQDGSQGQGVLIEGSGVYGSKTFGKQNITILGESNAEISGVTVTNLQSRGTGIWVESANPTIRNSTFVNSLREGIFVTGNSAPQIENNSFIKNSANGISIVGNSSGQIRANRFQETGFGIAIGGEASPLVENNQIQQNRAGIVIGNRCKPTLRSNQISNNKDNGVVVLPGGQPILSGGSNTIQGNGRFDLFAPQAVISDAGGNQISKSEVLVISGRSDN